MPGQHSNSTISFRPTPWERAMIEERVRGSGLYKKDFIARSCIYSNIVVVGEKTTDTVSCRRTKRNADCDEGDR